MGSVFPATEARIVWNSREQAEPQEPQSAPTVLTAMARQGDIEIEVTDPDRHPIGKIYCDSRVIDLPGGRKGIVDS